MADPALSVRQVMHPDPLSVPPTATVGEVLDVLNRHRVGAVVVADADAKLAGIFTERDLLRRVGHAAPGWRDMPVAGWMTADPYTIGPKVGWDEAVGMMDKLRVRHLPVVEDGRVVGMVSARGLMGRRADVLKGEVERRTRDLRTANDQLIARDAESVYNLRAAGRVQTRLLLPHAPPDWPELRWGVHYAPLDHLGGDYYDLARPDPDHLGFLIADASGHSLPAAMVAIMARIAFGEVAGTTTSPGAVLAAVNKNLQGLADERFVTAFYGVLNRHTGRFTYAAAGHPHPFLVRPSAGVVRPLSAQGFILGIVPDEEYREKAVDLEPGDRICFYTDGLFEARNEIGDTYGTDRLAGSLRDHGGLSADRLTAAVMAAQKAFSGTTPMTDDCTLVVVELCPPAA